MVGLADPITALSLAATAYGAWNQYQTGRRQQEYQEQLEREAAISPEEARRYNELANQLAWMAGLDPSQFYLQPTGPYSDQSVPLPGTVASAPFQAISDEAINEVIAQAQRDLATQAGTLGEQALGMAARRGLAGSSLVDQALANIGSESARELSRTRTQAELQAEQLTRQYGQQALQMLMGLNPNDLQSLQAAAGAYEAMLNQLAQQQAGWGSLVTGGLQYGLPGIEEWMKSWWPWQPKTADTDDKWRLNIPYDPFS